MRVTRCIAAVAAAILAAVPAAAGQTGPAVPAAQVPAGGAPQPAAGAPAAPPQGTQATTPATATAPAAARSFTAPVGLLFNTVRPDHVGDFERVIGYLQAALDQSTDPTTQAQARGWRVYKAAEPGPNGSVLYVFVLDPAVPSADYGLGRILADAYPDTAQLQEIWKLYTGSVTSGGTLLNLSRVQPPAPGAPATPGVRTPSTTTTPPATTPDRPLPPDADPNRQPLRPGQP